VGTRTDDVETGTSRGTLSVANGSEPRLTMSVEEAAKVLGISRSLAYKAVTTNEIPHIRIGRRILIPRSRLQQLLDHPSE